MHMYIIIDIAVIFLFIFALRKEGEEEQRRWIMSDWMKYSVLLLKCSFLCNLSSRHLVEEKENEIDVGGRIAGAGDVGTTADRNKIASKENNMTQKMNEGRKSWEVISKL